jgi:hypothetical protein
MTQKILVYYAGIVNIAGKGPNWIEPYNPNKTLGEVIKTMKKHGFGNIKIFKYEKKNINKFDKNNLYWSPDTKLSEYVYNMGFYGNDVMLVYHNM